VGAAYESAETYFEAAIHPRSSALPLKNIKKSAGSAEQEKIVNIL
jgi:hypothetical protein